MKLSGMTRETTCDLCIQEIYLNPLKGILKQRKLAKFTCSKNEPTRVKSKKTQN